MRGLIGLVIIAAVICAIFAVPLVLLRQYLNFTADRREEPTPTAPCKNCGRVNAVTTSTCPRCGLKAS